MKPCDSIVRKRAIEAARHDPPEAPLRAAARRARGSSRDAFVVCEGDQDLEDEGLERQVAVDLSGESGVGGIDQGRLVSD